MEMTLLSARGDEPQGSSTGLRWRVTVPVWARNRRGAGSQPGATRRREASSCVVSASRGDGAGGSWGDCLGASLTGFGVFSSGHPADRHRLPHHIATPRNPQGEHPSLPQPSFLRCPWDPSFYQGRGGTEGELQPWDAETPRTEKERASWEIGRRGHLPVSGET